MEQNEARQRDTSASRHVKQRDIRERMKELQDKTGDLSETLDHIEKKLLEAAGGSQKQQQTPPNGSG